MGGDEGGARKGGEKGWEWRKERWWHGGEEGKKERYGRRKCSHYWEGKTTYSQKETLNQEKKHIQGGGFTFTPRTLP